MNFKDVRFIPALNGRDHCLGTVQEVCVEIHHYPRHLIDLPGIFLAMGGRQLLGSPTSLSTTRK